MTQTPNYARAFNFHHRYASDLKDSPALNVAFRQRISQTRKYGGPVFENFLVELKKKFDTLPADDRYAISKEEYYDIKKFMLNINSVDVNYFNKILDDLLYFRLLPTDFDDWDYEFHYVDDIPIVFTAVTCGYIPEGFDRWEQCDNEGRCVAHLAAWKTILPKDFTQFDLKDKNGFTVQQVLDSVKIFDIYHDPLDA